MVKIGQFDWMTPGRRPNGQKIVLILYPPPPKFSTFSENFIENKRQNRRGNGKICAVFSVSVFEIYSGFGSVTVHFPLA